METAHAGDLLLLISPLHLSGAKGTKPESANGLDDMLAQLQERRLVRAWTCLPASAAASKAWLIQRSGQMAGAANLQVSAAPEDAELAATLRQIAAESLPSALVCVEPRCLLACLAVAERGGHFQAIAIARLTRP